MGYPRGLLARWDKVAAALTARGEPWTEDMIAMDLELLAERGAVPGERAAAARWCLRSRGSSTPGSGVYEARQLLAAWREDREGGGDQLPLVSERAPRHEAPAWWDLWKPAGEALALLGIQLPVEVVTFDLAWWHNQAQHKGATVPGVSALARRYGWVSDDDTPARGRVQRLLDAAPWASWDGLREVLASAPPVTRAEPLQPVNRRHRTVIFDGVEIEVQPHGFSEAVDLLEHALLRFEPTGRDRIVRQAEAGELQGSTITWAVGVIRHSGLGVSRRRTDVIRFLAAAASAVRLRRAG